MIKRESILRIVQAASKAPSGDNCQPWFFEWDGGEKLYVTHRNDRGEHSLNRANHASYLSLGAVIESVRIASSSEKYLAKFHWDPKVFLSEPYVDVTFQPSGTKPEDLLPALDLRTTDRRFYQNGPLDGPWMKEIRRMPRRFRTREFIFKKNHLKK